VAPGTTSSRPGAPAIAPVDILLPAVDEALRPPPDQFVAICYELIMSRAPSPAAPRSDFERVFLGPDGLGLEARAAAAFLQVTEVTVRRWAEGTMQPPGTVRGIVAALDETLAAMPRAARGEAGRIVRERLTTGVGGLFAEALARAAARAARPAPPPAGEDGLRREVAALARRIEALERRAGVTPGR